MSQRQFASYFGMPVRTLQDWEQGRFAPQKYVADMMKRILILEKGHEIMATEFENMFERTMNNCRFYKRENMEMHLLNEIGVLRGIHYCLEACGRTQIDNEAFLRFAEMQVEMLKDEKFKNQP